MKFLTGEAIQVRLSTTFCAAVGVPPDADIELWGAEIEDGWLLADYRQGDGTIMRYAVPPEHVIYVRQNQTPATPPAPQVLP